MRKSHIIATAVLTLGAAMLPSTAFAEPPQNLTSRFTDLANVVADDGAVAAELDKIPGDDFWIVTVNDLDGKEAQAWAEQTHKRSGMDRHDGLVVISVGTSEVGWYSTAKDPGVSGATLNKALNPQVMALFGEHKWDEAVIA
ncbi:TPM domain-containing protein, partial [Trueperella pyogenes]